MNGHQFPLFAIAGNKPHKRISSFGQKVLLQPSVIFSILMLIACTLLQGAQPLIKMDFNDSTGAASLVSRGTLSATGSFQGQGTYSSSIPPVNQGGYSGVFDGTGDRVSFGSVSGLSGLQSFTIAGWVNVSSPQTSGSPRIVSYTTSSGGGIDFMVSAPVGGATCSLTLGVDGDLRSDTKTFSYNTWVFVAVSYDGTKTSNNVQFYVGNSGTLTATGLFSTNQAKVNVVAGQILLMGGMVTTPTDYIRDYNGLMDGFQIYGSSTDASGVLTLAQLDAIRTTSDYIPPSPLVDVNFNEAAGASVVASHGTLGASGTFQGNAALSSTVPSVNGGGYSGMFDGTGDRVNFGNLSGLNGLRSFTVAGWVNFGSNQVSTDPRVLSYKGASGGIDFLISSATSSPKLKIGVDGTFATDTATLSYNNWAFVAVTYDGTKTTNNVQFYVGNSGTLTATGMGTVDMGAVDADAGQNLLLGGIVTTPTDYQNDYKGLLDGIKIYGSATDQQGVLTFAQLDQIRKATDYKTVLAGWGWNSRGELGDGTTNNQSLPKVLDSTFASKTLIASASGYCHSLGLTADGLVFAWGNNTSGQLGDGTTTDRLTPVPVSASGVLAGKSVVAIAAGAYHNLALDSAGSVYSWGENASGELGDVTYVQENAPVAVSPSSGALFGKTVVAIAAGFYHSLALDSTGAVYSWGLNSYGQLGDGSNTLHIGPVVAGAATSSAMLGKAVVAIAAGNHHSLALTSDGQVLAWGWNSYGQLGDGTTTDRWSPVAVSSSAWAGKTVVAIKAGAFHSMVLTSDGKIFAWGWNSYGQLGDGTTTQRNTPVCVAGALASRPVRTMGAGVYNSFALTSDGALFAWGNNADGEIGDGTGINQSLPTAIISNGGLVSAIGAGYYHNSTVLACLPPTPITGIANGVTATGATLNATVNPNAFSTTVYFDYGPTSAYGNTTTSQAVGNGTIVTPYNATLTGLSKGTTHYRLVATNSNGTSYGVDQSFSSLSANADLSSLVISSGTLSPNFISSGISYSMNLVNAVSSISVTPVKADAGATIQLRINGGNYSTVSSGIPSDEVTLKSGANLIDVTVTAENGIAVKTYTISVASADYLGWCSRHNLVGLEADPSADVDKDGVANLVEYATNRDPTSPDAAKAPVVGTTHIGASDYLTLTFSRVSGTDITCTPQVSSDLIHWASGDLLIEETVTNDDGITATVMARDLEPLQGNPRRFIRLQVTRAP